MDGLVTLLKLAYSSGSVYISDVMHLAFQREVQEERGWCVHFEDRLAYLDAIIWELELCSNRASVARFFVELRNGDYVVFADAIMYFKAIRNFEADKLDNLYLFLQASVMHVARRSEFVARFGGV
ncbi:hypothetical protein CTI12_AA337270 [Artemisia annua]|uniref:Uncharacterized protein n=1 Tax=Artemisia annua TaxID=35608 RepID=A0A2U1MVF6_ARTAN|nr:hypothetical protein CTI12_AA337270 [Artemisia annua]